MSLIPLLLLADGRLPSGAHAHSGGLESAVHAGRVDDADTLQSFLLGRLTTVGLTSAAFAAATVLELADGILATAGGGSFQSKELAVLDGEFDARTPSPALREASRKSGHQLVRAASAGWPSPVLEAAAQVHPDGPHQPIAFGAAAAAAGLDVHGTAAAAALSSVTGPAATATRLLSIDPDAVTAVLAGLTDAVDEIAAAAVRAARGPAEDLPALSAPLLDIAAEQHLTWEVRLFAS
jgi:urease accessory protein